ncbi:hypothetical protein GBAR_LOCUS1035 [Geodia barretti]|uniref:Uncharacterized protein n=1 Tax=Geodia barretti TaxID=519541 RepID=A0AA35QUF3_GEOBA|nr:hypothetical protein GBAR_LOCUS1035 [Geodia barretti]
MHMADRDTHGIRNVLLGDLFRQTQPHRDRPFHLRLVRPPATGNDTLDPRGLIVVHRNVGTSGRQNRDTAGVTHDYRSLQIPITCMKILDGDFVGLKLFDDLDQCLVDRLRRISSASLDLVRINPPSIKATFPRASADTTA